MKFTVTSPPVGTELGKVAEFTRHVVLPAGFCEYKITVPGNQVSVPVFRNVTETLYEFAASMDVGTDWDTNSLAKADRT